MPRNSHCSVCCAETILPQRFDRASKLTTLVELAALKGLDVQILEPDLWELYDLERRSSGKGSVDIDTDYPVRNRLSRKYRRSAARLNAGLILKFALPVIKGFHCLCAIRAILKAAINLALEQHIAWNMEEPSTTPNTYRKRSKLILWITNCCKLFCALRKRRVTDSPKNAAFRQIERSKEARCSPLPRP